MSLSRILAIARKQFLTLRHDPRTLALMLLAPIMAMLIFGFAFGTQPKHIRVTVVNQDKGPLAAEVIDRIDHTALDITQFKGVEAAKNQVRDGKKVAAIIFPPDFTENASPRVSVGAPGSGPPSPPVPVAPPKGARVQVFLDTTNQQLSGVVSKALADGAQSLAKSKGAATPISFDLQYAFPKAKNARYIDYFVPGVMAFAVTLFTTLLTLLAFVGERTSGTLDRLRVTPVNAAEIVLGYEIAFGAIAAVQGFLILVVALLVYNILIVGSVALAALLIILTAIDAQAIGILVSSAAQRESQAVQFLPFIIFPIFLLSGIFVAVQSLPSWLQPFSYLLPPTWGIDAMRDVLLRGWGIEHVWPHILILTGFAVVFSFLAVFGLRRS